MKKLREVLNIIKNKNFTQKIKIYMSTTSVGDGYDSYENNKTFSNLNYLTIKGLIRSVSAEKAYYKGYGKHTSGMKEIITEKRYIEAFKNCNKIVIGQVEYQVFKDGTGNMSIIERNNDLISVAVTRLD